MTTNGAVNGLPPHLSQEDVPEATPEVQFKHQWLYSVIPVGRKYETWTYGSNGESTSSLQFPLVPILTAFCRYCSKVFSVEIPVEGEYYNQTAHYLETKTDIPQWGCVDPNAGV